MDAKGWQYVCEDATDLGMEANATAKKETVEDLPSIALLAFLLSKELYNWFTISSLFHAVSSLLALELL